MATMCLTRLVAQGIGAILPYVLKVNEGFKLGDGLRENLIYSERAYSSDSLVVPQTKWELFEELGLHRGKTHIAWTSIRECGISVFEMAYDGDLFMGIIPRIFKMYHVHQLSYAELAEGLVEVDTALWRLKAEKLCGADKEEFEI